MEPITFSETDVAEYGIDEDALVLAWRTEQLRRLGLPRALAETYAGSVDWHEIEELVARGCPLPTALEIVR